MIDDAYCAESMEKHKSTNPEENFIECHESRYSVRPRNYYCYNRLPASQMWMMSIQEWNNYSGKIAPVVIRHTIKYANHGDTDISCVDDPRFLFREQWFCPMESTWTVNCTLINSTTVKPLV